MNHDDNCNCKICKDFYLFYINIEKVQDENTKKYFRQLFDAYHLVYGRADYYQAVLNGVWNNSDELIKEMRRNYKIEHAEDYI